MMKKLKIVLLVLILTLCSITASFSPIETLAEGDFKDKYSCRLITSYNYQSSTPASAVASEDYLKNSLIGGDSRVSDLPKLGVEVYYVTSLSLWRIYDMKVNEKVNKPLYDILDTTEKKNIYLFLGINEINGTNFDVWKEELDTLVKEYKEKHPEKNIYFILGYHPRSMNGMSLEDLTKAVDVENEKIIEVAKKYHIFYINPNESTELMDEKGLIKEQYTWDGVHLNEAGAQVFADFIKTHVYQEEVYVEEICE